MTKERPTRYRATWEFELRYHSDYRYLRETLQRFVDGLQENYGGLSSDYLAIEKIEQETAR